MDKIAQHLYLINIIPILVNVKSKNIQKQNLNLNYLGGPSGRTARRQSEAAFHLNLSLIAFFWLLMKLRSPLLNNLTAETSTLY